jgi:two-component system sensor histidine kinase CpxA
MKIRLPLSLKILAWFFLNIALVGAGLLMLGQLQFRFGLDSLVSGHSGDRLQDVSNLISAEIRGHPSGEWTQVLQRFSVTYGVTFGLFQSNGHQLAGAKIPLPADVEHRLQQMAPGRGRRPPAPFPGPPEFGEPAPPPPELRPEDRRGTAGEPADPRARMMLHTSAPTRYWVLMRIPAAAAPQPPPGQPPLPLTLIAESASINGGGLFFEITPWLYAGAGVLLLSLLLWIPLVRGITRAIAEMSAATQRIAGGAFDTRIHSPRNDELGALAQSINDLAQRLEGFVAGQKRFLGDIAHELCTPIARMQMAMGILEQQARVADPQTVDDLREELQEMSLLVNELLSFSKASLGARALERTPVNLRELIEKVIQREQAGAASVEVQVAGELRVLAEPDLLQRALANLVRNALRYAGGSGPIGFAASREASLIRLTVWDRGPGIPAEALAKVFEPFYRVDPSRDRETGGVGLGLAIVKTCIEGCGGTIRCQNRAGGGAEFILELSSAQE